MIITPMALSTPAASQLEARTTWRTRGTSPAPRLWPTSAPVACEMLSPGTNARDCRRMPMPCAATASGSARPKSAMITNRAEFMIIMSSAAGAPTRKSSLASGRSMGAHDRRSSSAGSAPRRSRYTVSSTPTSWARMVPQAAPASPSAGTGPMPKISTVLSSTLSRFTTMAANNAKRVLPTPRSTAPNRMLRYPITVAAMSGAR